MKELIKSIIKTFLFFDLSLIIINYLPEIAGKNPAVSALKNSGISLAVVLGLTLIYVLLVEKRRVCLPFKKPVLSILKGIFFGALIPVITVALTKFLGKSNISKADSIKNIALWILALFISCVTNELLLRGYLFSLFKKHFGITAAVISSTVLFCAIDLNIFSCRYVISTANRSSRMPQSRRMQKAVLPPQEYTVQNCQVRRQKHPYMHLCRPPSCRSKAVRARSMYTL